MLEKVMFFALGGLFVLLLALAFLPALWGRAERLAMRRLSWRLPMSSAEVSAERDVMRAEIAVRERKAEQRIVATEQARKADQDEVGRKLIEIHAKDGEISLLGTQLQTMSSEKRAAEERGQALDADLAEARTTIAVKETSITTLGLDLSALKSELKAEQSVRARLESALAERVEQNRADESRHAAALAEKERQLALLAKERAAIQQQLSQREAELEQSRIANQTSKVELNEQRRQAALLDQQISSLSSEIASLRAANTKAAADLTRRIAELGSERQVRKDAEFALKEAERKSLAELKRVTLEQGVRSRSDEQRVVAMEREGKAVLKREQDLRKQLDDTRRDAQESNRDLARTVERLTQEAERLRSENETLRQKPMIDASATTQRTPDAPLQRALSRQDRASDPSVEPVVGDTRQAIADMRDKLRKQILRDGSGDVIEPRPPATARSMRPANDG
jgi:DNA repair exonuclease SbcCD ATPase subunit